MKLKSKTRKVCPTCGFKVRTKNHDEGQHHKSGSNGKLTINQNKY